jgi:shikimate dehydrogenase
MSLPRTNLAVFGNPVGHSLSPRIHHLFAEQTGQQVLYRAIQPPENAFASSVKQFFSKQGKGCNLTLPFKIEAYQLADKLTQRAEVAGAVNTLFMDEQNQLCGDNTDGQGLVADLKRLLGSLSEKNCLLIGAGGATRGVIAPLIDAGTSKVWVTNRSYQKVEQLLVDFADFDKLTGCKPTETAQIQPDIVINCTSSSINNALPEVSEQLFAKAKLAYDMYYQSAPTAFMHWAKRCNPDILTSDGLGMLVGQAAESYRIWMGVQPEIKPILAKIRAEL